MATIVVWAFFILWGLTIIQSLMYRNVILAFNLAIQIFVVRQFYIDEVYTSWKTIIAAIALCWGVFILSCLPKAIMQFRRQRRWERAAKRNLTG